MTGREASAAPRSPLVIAHRGQRATFPEQTLEAYEAAIRLGAEAIETDVQRTGDGRLAMMHDLTLDRTTNGRGRIADHDWAAVRALDAGSWFGAGFGGCRVPSLDETIELVVGAGRGLCVEIKGSPPDAPMTAIAVARLLRERALLDRVYVSSFDHVALAAARAEVHGLLLAPERLPEAGPSDPPAAAAQAVALGAAALQHRWEDLTTDVVDAVHAVGTAVWAWPIDTLESIRHSVAVGADAIIGDDVALLVAGLRGSVPTAAPIPS